MSLVLEWKKHTMNLKMGAVEESMEDNEDFILNFGNDVGAMLEGIK